MLTYSGASIIPSNMHSGAGPFTLIAPQMCTLTGCFGLCCGKITIQKTTLRSYYSQYDNMFRTSVACTAAGIERPQQLCHFTLRIAISKGKSAAKANVSVLSFLLALKWCFRRTRSKGFYLTINRGVVERLEIYCWGRGYG